MPQVGGGISGNAGNIVIGALTSAVAISGILAVPINPSWCIHVKRRFLQNGIHAGDMQTTRTMPSIDMHDNTIASFLR